MSLTESQVSATRAELAENLARSGWTPTQLAQALGVAEERIIHALAVDGSRPADVWLVRDALDVIIVDSGDKPARYSALTESDRAAARGWFGVSTPAEVRERLTHRPG